MVHQSAPRLIYGSGNTHRVQKLIKSKGVGPLPQLLVIVCVMSTFTLLLQHNQTLQNAPFLSYVARTWNIAFDNPKNKTTHSSKEETCQPARRIVFLKTHKTGSSTIQNLLLRYAVRHNLSVVLPLKGVYLDRPEADGLDVSAYKKSPFAPPLGKYYFLIHHARLNVETMMQLTYPDAIWITIVRDPATLFESLYAYYYLARYYKVSFEHFVHRVTPFTFIQDKRVSHRFGRNQMAFDLGLKEEDFKDTAVPEVVMRVLDNVFHLVMITEYMDESLVLLKQLLCWPDEEMIVLAKNVRKTEFKKKLTSSEKQKLRNYNFADKKIYEHFHEKFHQQIKLFGKDRMVKEVEKLQDKRRETQLDCQLSIRNRSEEIKGYNTHLIVNYKYNSSNNSSKNSLCEELLIRNTQLNDVLRNKQYRRYQNIDVDWTPLYQEEKRKPVKPKAKQTKRKKSKKKPKKQHKSSTANKNVV